MVTIGGVSRAVGKPDLSPRRSVAPGVPRAGAARRSVRRGVSSERGMLLKLLIGCACGISSPQNTGFDGPSVFAISLEPRPCRKAAIPHGFFGDTFWLSVSRGLFHGIAAIGLRGEFLEENRSGSRA